MTQGPGSSSTSSKGLAVGGAFWLLSLEFFLGQAIAQLAWTGSPYSLYNNVISDLGITVCETVKGDYLCSPLHNVMNASFILAGTMRMASSAVSMMVGNIKMDTATAPATAEYPPVVNTTAP